MLSEECAPMRMQQKKHGSLEVETCGMHGIPSARATQVSATCPYLKRAGHSSFSVLQQATDSRRGVE